MFEKHVFVCTNRRTDGRQACGDSGSEEIHKALKAEARTITELRGKLRINKAGCLGLCKLGPTVVVYPETTWYTHVKLEDVKALAESLKTGVPVAGIHHEPKPEDLSD